MSGRLSIAALLFLATLVSAPAKAQNVVVEERILPVAKTQDARAIGDAFITFRINEAVIEAGYMDNRAQLSSLAAQVERFRMNIDSVTIIAFASPEGRYAFNQKLSARRAKAVKDYLRSHWKDVDFGKIREFAGGPDFAGLSAALETDYQLPYREEVLAITSDWGANPDATFARLRALHDGEPFDYIFEKYLPWLRNATTVIFHYDRSTSLYEERDSVKVSVVVDKPLDKPAEGDVVSVYVKPVNTGGDATVVNVTGDASVLPPVAGTAAGTLPPAASSQAGLLPPGSADTTTVVSAAVKYVVDDPVAVTTIPKVNEQKAEEQKVEEQRVEEQRVEEQKADRKDEEKETVVQEQPKEPRQPKGPRKPKEPRQSRVREPRPERVRTYLDERPMGGVSTNLLFDAVTAVNVGLEIPMGQRWAAHLEFNFPWWTWNGGANAFQVNHGQLSLRRWFNPIQFDGWYLSAGVGGGRYDIEPFKTGVRGYEFMGGVGGGYSLPLTRNWILDFGLGLGTIYTKMDQYQTVETGARVVTQGDRRLLLISPTDLHVSLIYLFYPW